MSEDILCYRASTPKFWDKNYPFTGSKILHHCFLGLLWWRCLMLSRFLSFASDLLFLSGRSQYLFLIASALRFLDGVSCSELLFCCCDGPLNANSCLQFWNIIHHSYIKLPEQNSHFSFLSPLSSFFLSWPFSQFCKNFFQIPKFVPKTLILSSLLYFKFQHSFFVVVPFIQQLILASWMQYLSSFFHSLFHSS